MNNLQWLEAHYADEWKDVVEAKQLLTEAEEHRAKMIEAGVVTKLDRLMVQGARDNLRTAEHDLGRSIAEYALSQVYYRDYKVNGERREIPLQTEITPRPTKCDSPQNVPQLQQADQWIMALYPDEEQAKALIWLLEGHTEDVVKLVKQACDERLQAGRW